MSRLISHTGITWTGHPTTWLGVSGSYGGSNDGWSTSYPYTNCFASSSSSTYGQIVPPSSSMTNPCTQRFGFSISGIPSNATITSVTCNIKICCNQASGIGTATVQFYCGDTAKGTALSFPNDASQTVRSYTTCGTWTLAELEDLELRIISKKSGSSNRYINFYGADLNITYSYDETQYEITSSSSSATVTISPASQFVTEGGSGTVTLNNISDITEVLVLDNNVGKTNDLVNTSGTTYTYTIDNISEDHVITVQDVPAVYITVTNNSTLVSSIQPVSGSSNKTAQGSSFDIKIFTNEIDHINIFDDDVKNNDVTFQNVIEEDSVSLHPSSNANVNFSTWASASNGHGDTSSTTRTNIQAGTSSVQSGEYYFDCSSIPSNATILSVSCKVKICVSNTYSSGSGVQLYSGTTSKSNLNTSWISNKNANIYTLANIGSFTRAELDNVKLVIYGKSGGNGRSIYFYGADLDISYEYQGAVYYLYTTTANKNKTVRIETRPTYTVTASSQVSGNTISPASSTVYEGNDLTLTLSIPDINVIYVTDNGVNVTNSLVGSGTSYTYTITNISASHTITIIEQQTTKVYFKTGNLWVQYSKIYKKVSGSWSEVSDFTNVFESNKIYVLK